MKIVKYFLLPVFVLLAVLYVLSLLAPDYWDVSASTEIAAPPEEIHKYLDNLSHWEQWVNLSRGDKASFVLTYEGPAAGVGAIAYSKAPGSSVRWEITASDPQKGIWFNEVLEADFAAKGAIMLEAQGDVTMVTWVDRGSLGDAPFIHLFHYVMQNALEERFQENLGNLKELVEASVARREDSSGN